MDYRSLDNEELVNALVSCARDLDNSSLDSYYIEEAEKSLVFIKNELLIRLNKYNTEINPFEKMREMIQESMKKSGKTSEDIKRELNKEYGYERF